jgi:dethiobiotin synthetase
MPGILLTGARGVGKTAVACGILGALRERGIKALPFKPVETGRAGSGLADAVALRMACGVPLRNEEITPYGLPDALAPVLAAERAGTDIDLKVLERSYEALATRSDLVVVETDGGLAAPMRRDPWFTYADMAFNWGLPIIFVAAPDAAGLEHTVLTVEYARRKGLSLLGIIVNGMPEGGVGAAAAERGTSETLGAMTGLPMLGVIPKRPEIDPASGKWQSMVHLARGLDLWRIQNLARPLAR